jgi:hypothetical protein
MIFFGAVEGRGGFDLGGDGATEASGGFELRFRSARRLFLLGRVIENHTAVLGADIGALAIDLGWVVGAPEYVEQTIIADFRRIVLDLDHFGVAGQVGADVFICGIRSVAASVADGCVDHAVDVAEGRFNSPETAGTERCFFRHMVLLSPVSGTRAAARTF